MAEVVPRAELASLVRDRVAAHDDWDGKHEFVSLHWDGQAVTPGMLVIIDNAVRPSDYPDIMTDAAAEGLRCRDVLGSAPCAYLAMFEAWGMDVPGPGASRAERVAYEAGRRQRTFHENPDATEWCVTYCADVHGRLFAARKARLEPGHITEAFYPPMTPAPREDEYVIRGLMAAARNTAALAYGLT